MKVNVIWGLLMLLIALGGCSNPTPPDRFLTANLAVTPSGGTGEAEAFHMRAVDLYNLFDLNATKKWKRVHENSWKIFINGTDPSTKKSTLMVITLAVDPESGRKVLVRAINLGGKESPPDEIAAMIRQLDQRFIPKGRKSPGGPG